MDEQKRTEDEQVEDLDTPESEADEVKGGFSWGVSQTIKGELGANKVGIKGELSGLKRGLDGLQGLDGGGSQHNETLIRI